MKLWRAIRALPPLAIWRAIAATTVLVVAILTVPAALAPVWNSADAIVVAAAPVFLWLAWPRDAEERARRHAIHRAHDEACSRVDEALDRDYPRNR